MREYDVKKLSTRKIGSQIAFCIGRGQKLYFTEEYKIMFKKKHKLECSVADDSQTQIGL